MRRWAVLAVLFAVFSAPLSAAEQVPSVGTATMAADGTIEMRLVSLPPGPIAHTTMTVHPGDKDYKSILDHIGGMKPGETKSVPAWPDDPPKTTR